MFVALLVQRLGAQYWQVGFVMVNLPAQISCQGIRDSLCDGGFGCRNVMLVTILADKMKEFLEVRHFDDAIATKSIQLIFRKASLAQVRSHPPGQIVSRHAAIRERSGTNAPNDGSVSVFFADRSRDDLLVIHFLLAEEGLGQVRAMKHHSLVRLAVEIIVPIE